MIDMLAYLSRATNTGRAMKRTTVKIPDELDARLRHEAERRDITISELTREALEAHLGGPNRPPRHLRAAGAFSSGRSDIGRRIEEILDSEAEEIYKEWHSS